MTCNEIENQFPAYMEDLLSPEERKSIEGHLASCSRCSRALAELKKMDELLQGLGEVEPPPFFEQRIMSRIREEAGQKKGIFQRLFYPLYIKIPVQVLATFLIVVLAFHVYQKGEPEMKQVVPFPTPLTENGKGRGTAEFPKDIAVPFVVTPAKRAPAGNLPDKSQQWPVAPPFKSDGKESSIADSHAPIREARSAAMKTTAPAMEARGRDIPSVKAEGMGTAQERAEKPGADNVSETLLTQQKTKDKMAVKRSAIDMTIQVRDAYAAIREIEERLGQFNARIIERQHLEGNDILKVEIAAQNVASFFDRLKEIGRANVEKSPLIVPDGNVTVSIKIKGY